MAPDRAARLATFVLLAVAFAACEVASYPDGRPRTFGVVSGLVTLTAAILISYSIPSNPRNLPRSYQLILIAVCLLPLVVEPLLRSWIDNGFPLELQLVNGLRLLGLLLCGFSVVPRVRRLAAVVALFLALFTSAMGDQPAIPYLLGLFALAGGVWLVLNHHVENSGNQPSTIFTRIDRSSLKLPYREAVIFAIVMMVAVGMAAAGPRRVVLTLGELVPTSGGTGETDPFARYGVGDGPEETAGPNARAAGMVETDKMIEDNKDALIDAVNDMYGPPHKPRNDQDRMIAVGLMDVIKFHGKLPDGRRPGRDFDTGRAGPKRDNLQPEDRAARGLFEVEGRTPLHVRVVVYDRYDATSGLWSESRKPSSRFLESEGNDWMRNDTVLSTAEWYGAEDTHKLKVANLRDNLVPTPTLLSRVRIQHVDRADYYQWDYDGVLTLADRRRTPPGVIVATECKTVDPRSLPEAAFASSFRGHSEVPASLQPLIDRFAREWAGHEPRGWSQIESVLRRLREDYIHEPQSSPPATHPDAITWFLSESGRGPDYLFATSAALVLRSLGYSTRVCLGYYARPSSYDEETDHTPVRHSDLHMWAEVQLSDGHWLVVEATPGFEVLPPLKSWSERLQDACSAVATWAYRNLLALLIGAMIIVGLIARRRHLLDWFMTTWWRLFPGRNWQDAVTNTVRILERRGRLSGVPRPIGQSLSAWGQQLIATRGESCGFAELLGFVDRALYAPSLGPPLPLSELRTACRTTLEKWTLSEFSRTGAMNA